MALHGTLADLGIVDLIQFPHKSRRTGELVVAGPDEEARLYYVDGALSHVAAGEATGMEGLVEVVSWTDGEFEFRPDVAQSHRTIDMDLHRALMLALKTRDERAENERKRQQQTKEPSPSGGNGWLADILKAYPNLQGACVFSDEGTVLAEAVAEEEDPTQIAALRESVIALYRDYARPGLTRAYLEDDHSIAHGIRLPGGSVAILAAGRETAMGTLSLTMSKLVGAMKEKLG